MGTHVSRLNKTKFGKIFEETLKQNSRDCKAPTHFVSGIESGKHTNIQGPEEGKSLDSLFSTHQVYGKFWNNLWTYSRPFIAGNRIMFQHWGFKLGLFHPGYPCFNSSLNSEFVKQGEGGFDTFYKGLQVYFIIIWTWKSKLKPINSMLRVILLMKSAFVILSSRVPFIQVENLLHFHFFFLLYIFHIEKRRCCRKIWWP